MTIMLIRTATYIGKTLYYLVRRFIREGHTYRAASLVYATLLALVPLGIVTFGILSIFDVFYGLWPKLQDLILMNFVPHVAQSLSFHLVDILKNFKGLSLFNLIFLFLTCVLLLYNISCAFNVIWEAARPRPKHWVVIFLIYVVFIILTPIFIGFMFVSTAWLVTLSLISKFLSSFWFIRPSIFFTSPYIGLFILFTFFNWMLPICHVRLRDAAIGGLCTTILFEFAKNIFVVYLRHFPTYQILYGALAIFPIFLLWLYIAWLIILFGAMVSHAASERFQVDRIK
jgi:membrane protein